ncbi:adenosylmethionine--8-amino-7-oxononanoate transaminase [Clostridium hydrogeniformans]|uniref:adenosylmethionine--8-amino-7-oxononanoate transaminase n=1 Tax=Clostridium hydrogeniformans TaxID=349933 RepID=UPI0004807510|nr:adenosylmethionine--8-amino-7-oxononanoate transaminase [Clostridium hydrogeniformans]
MNLVEKDLKYIWHPASQMKDYEDLNPVIIENGKGAYLYDIHGNKYLDCISSWWVNLFGHCNERINNAINKQLNSLEHVIFAHLSNVPAVELSEKLVDITPEPLKKVFFCDNGSSAVEVALKISYQYHKQKGNQKKTKFVALENSYHGETLGALSACNVGFFKDTYKDIIIETYKCKSPNCYRCEFGLNRESCSAECFKYMEELISKYHEEICGIIIEPMVQGAAGMNIYSKEYLKKLRKLCDEYDITFIGDEIAVGFGRTGKMFASNHSNISPDIMTLSKGITGGYLPLSVVMVTEEIYNCFYDDYEKLTGFFHSHSYSGNALACAAAVETMNIFHYEDIINKNIEKFNYMKDLSTEVFKDIKNVGEYRQLGFIGAIELVQNKDNKTPIPWEKRVGYSIYKRGLKNGLLLRPMGNIIYFMPPYIVNKDDLDFMIKGTYKCIKEEFKF